MKSYTDLEQSKKLAEILPLESADMFYNKEPEDETYPKDIVDTKYPMILREGQKHFLEEYGIPCWSLAALLDVLLLPDLIQDKVDGELFWQCSVYDEDGNSLCETYDNNPIDACYEMIIKLNELNLL